MPVLAQLRAFVASRNGKLTVGGTAVGGVVAAALWRRHQGAAAGAGTDGGAAAGGTAPTPAYLQSTGTSGTNDNSALPDPGSGLTAVDSGQLQDLITNQGRIADELDTFINSQQPAPTGSPVPTPVPTSNPPPTSPLPPAVTPPTPAGGKVAPSVPWPGRNLTLGSSGGDVSTWQAGANARVGAGLVVDGKYGPKSAAAARRIQAQAGIAQDGIVGRQTWNVTFYGSP